MCQVLVKTPKPLENDKVNLKPTCHPSCSREFGLAVPWIPYLFISSLSARNGMGVG